MSIDWSANFPDSDFVVNATPANYFQYEPRRYERSDGPLFSLPANWDAAMQLAQIRPPGGQVPPRAPGLYVQVLDGIINLSNKGGSLNFSAGQFGFTPSFRQPPIVLPANPGLKFAPPPSFSSPSVSPGNSGASSKPKSVDCEVR